MVRGDKPGCHWTTHVKVKEFRDPLNFKMDADKEIPTFMMSVNLKRNYFELNVNQNISTFNDIVFLCYEWFALAQTRSALFLFTLAIQS
jgi:hypothetical protein